VVKVAVQLAVQAVIADYGYPTADSFRDALLSSLTEALDFEQLSEDILSLCGCGYTAVSVDAVLLRDTYPTLLPTHGPTPLPSTQPTPLPSNLPTSLPSALPSSLPTLTPTPLPTQLPTPAPTPLPSSGDTVGVVVTMVLFVANETDVAEGVFTAALIGFLAGADAADPNTVRSYSATYTQGGDSRRMLTTTTRGREMLSSPPPPVVLGIKATVTFTVVAPLSAVGYPSADLFEAALVASLTASLLDGSFREALELSCACFADPVSVASQPTRDFPTFHPTPLPTMTPSTAPTTQPSPLPSAAPTSLPSPLPSGAPTPLPSPAPTPAPTLAPTPLPSALPSPLPTPLPSALPTSLPSLVPTPVPTLVPSSQPSPLPTLVPSLEPTPTPTSDPTPVPSSVPSPLPTEQLRGYKDCVCFTDRWIARLQQHCPAISHHFESGCLEGGVSMEKWAGFVDYCPPLRGAFEN